MTGRPRVGDKNDTGDRIVRMDGLVAIYHHEERGQGYTVYLYEDPNWQLDADWLMRRGPFATLETADELYGRVIDLMSRHPDQVSALAR